ncbi:hypothetical protein [Saccharibacillus endophyticus]|uniref:Uncharacterized protein n=1 Tax=Saccharibacillus endophyticus TaxID=2060666 RepID=A0ABQ2A356_9BACL|nr:hypothetical protein [Saccharibacillus endophyticus]GGH83349.1 hypothetical protein GCM10007362_36050 [Saccharibacillus endophyticus]
MACDAHIFEKDDLMNLPAEHRFNVARPQDTPDFPGNAQPWADALIPFSLSGEEAEERFRAWSKSRRFTPRSFVREASLSSATPVFLPFWSFSMGTRSTYTAERGDDSTNYNTHTRTDSNGNTETYTESTTVTNYHAVSGDHEQIFEAVTVPASARFDIKLIDKSAAFDFSALSPCSPGYMRSCVLAAPEVAFPQGWESGKARIGRTLKDAITRKIGGNSVRDLKIQTDYAGPRFRRVLLPFYAFQYEYRGKRLAGLVNGQNGTVAGDVPRSGMKILTTILISMVIAAWMLYLLVR